MPAPNLLTSSKATVTKPVSLLSLQNLPKGLAAAAASMTTIVPAVLWVLYNILQPALNQLNRMRSAKAVVVGLGLGGGLAAAGFMSTPGVSADEIMAVADASSSGDSRGLLLLFVVAPAILWVLEEGGREGTNDKKYPSINYRLIVGNTREITWNGSMRVHSENSRAGRWCITALCHLDHMGQQCTVEVCIGRSASLGMYRWPLVGPH
ncbi:hypothetical protein BHE74_00025273 [Ensete ventricosum]|nr:hypothetical protein BHE74_00025273 [Ensete ventricosum]